MFSGEKDSNAVNRDNSGAGSDDEQDDDDDVVQFYDRSKSFFDNISCESLERAKGSVIAVVCFIVASQCCLFTGMLTKPEVDEANSHEAEAKIALIFSAKFYSLTPFSPMKRNFWSVFDWTSKISAQNWL